MAGRQVRNIVDGPSTWGLLQSLVDGREVYFMVGVREQSFVFLCTIFKLSRDPKNQTTELEGNSVWRFEAKIAGNRCAKGTYSTKTKKGSVQY